MSGITKELAMQMEACIKETHIQVTKLYPKGKILEINGGAACFSIPNGYLSQVVGWGFSTEADQLISEIELIENFYKNQGHTRVDIELTSFVAEEVITFLSQRGYRISESNNISALNLQYYEPLDCFDIKKVEPEALKEWSKQIALGFGYPQAENQFFRYAQAVGVNAYAAYDNEQIVAGGLISIQGRFGDLGVASTLPAYRGQGLQKKLLYQRLNLAKNKGLSWALVTTSPGTISDRNIQRVGFQPVYTRIKMTTTTIPC